MLEVHKICSYTQINSYKHKLGLTARWEASMVYPLHTYL